MFTFLLGHWQIPYTDILQNIPLPQKKKGGGDMFTFSNMLSLQKQQYTNNIDH